MFRFKTQLKNNKNKHRGNIWIKSSECVFESFRGAKSEWQLLSLSLGHTISERVQHSTVHNPAKYQRQCQHSLGIRRCVWSVWVTILCWQVDTDGGTILAMWRDIQMWGTKANVSQNASGGTRIKFQLSYFKYIKLQTTLERLYK